MGPQGSQGLSNVEIDCNLLGHQDKLAGGYSKDGAALQPCEAIQQLMSDPLFDSINAQDFMQISCRLHVKASRDSRA